MIRYLFSFLVLFICVNLTFTQTYITPLIGLDALRLQNSTFSISECPSSTDSRGCVQSGFVRNGPLFGVNLKQKFTKDIGLFYRGSFTHKKFLHTYLRPSFAFNTNGLDVTFKYIMHEIGLSWDSEGGFLFDLGLKYTQFNNIEFSYITLPANLSNFPDNVNVGNKKQYGYSVGCGYNFKNILLVFSLHQSFYNSENNNWLNAGIDSPIAFRLSLGYQFYLFDKIKIDNKKEGCPTEF